MKDCTYCLAGKCSIHEYKELMNDPPFPLL